MSRTPRLDIEDVFYHVYNRGNARAPLFIDPSEHIRFLRLLSDAKEKFPFRLHAYCLMPNHFHLLIQRKKVPLGVIMQRVQLSYARFFNRRRDRTGHVFEAPFKSIPCHNDAYFKTLLRYIHQNPVRAGLVANPSDWPWSGHRILTGDAEDFLTLMDANFPLRLFSSNPLESRILYRDFMNDPLPADQLDEIRESVQLDPDQSFENEDKFPGSNISRNLEELCLDVCEAFSLDERSFRGPNRHRALSPARRAFILDARESGFSVTAIGEFLGRSPSAISRFIAPGK